MSDSQLVDVALVLLGAGHETTANMLALGIFALLENPDQLAALRANPELIDNAVEELLRYLSIVQLGVTRVATQDVTLGGVNIAAGSTVIIATPEANRDDRQWSAPDRLDLRRERSPHLAFGHGVHQCLGQQLARIEMRVGFTELVNRLPGLRLAESTDDIPLRNDMLIFGVYALRSVGPDHQRSAHGISRRCPMGRPAPSSPDGEGRSSPSGEDRPTAVLGRRERKKLATRAAVRDAALRLAIRHGVENVTVEQIAAEADVAVRTFFNHYSSKEEAVLSLADAGSAALITEFRRRPAGESVLEAIRQAVRAVMERHDDAGRDYVRALQLIRRAPTLVPRQMAMLTAQESALADAIAERLGATASMAQSEQRSTADGPVPVSPERSRYPQLCAAMALAALRVALDRWLDQATNHNPPHLDVFRAEIDGAITQLATGLDRKGSEVHP